jgi:maltose alpha-D-glucosyltransferase/alpha-amylase
MNHTVERPRVVPARPQRAAGSPERDWYVWSDTVHKYEEAGSSSPTRDVELDVGRRGRRLLWHRFFSHQPDLNFDNADVQEAMLDALRFWLDLGLDGFRLDAVPVPLRARRHERREPPETHDFLKVVRGRSTRSTPTACCSPRPTSGRRTSSSTSATATSATWRSTSR